jgi:2-polyprenyl-3-methyl-5-hydroxy-6-metoxy-1,4-benzoquinol methylase
MMGGGGGEGEFNVSLIDSTGKHLATTTANRASDDLINSQDGDTNCNFIFYGWLGNVSQIVFSVSGSTHNVPISYTQPENPVFSPIHPDDLLFKFNLMYNYDNFHFLLEETVDSYVVSGIEHANKLKNICLEHFPALNKPLDLLEFCSGYGRITRHFDKSFFNIAASDIHQQAIQFIKDSFQIDAFLSTANPHDFIAPSQYDVVFALSIFSHLPDSTFGNWLAALYNCVRENGVLIFSTHGRLSNKLLKMSLKDGFGFQPQSEQKDLDTSDYGTTISELPYVLRKLIEKTGQYPILFSEGFWWGHQDIYIVKKYRKGA